MEDQEFPELDSLLLMWAEEQRLQPQESERIRASAITFESESSDALPYTWWLNLFEFAFSREASYYHAMRQKDRLLYKTLTISFHTPFNVGSA